MSEGQTPTDTVESRPLRIFISYRHEDSYDAAHLLYSRLARRFKGENVFIDVDSIPGGRPWRREIEDAIAACDVFLPLVVQHWLKVADAGGRRLDDPDDPLRFEIELALKEKERLHVVPIRLHGALTPDPHDLPESIADLLEYNFHPINADRWQADVSKLVRILEEIQREHVAQERLASEEAETIAREQAEQERVVHEHAERERVAQELAAQERLAREEAQRISGEQAEQARLTQQQAERERLEQEAARERLAREHEAEARRTEEPSQEETEPPRALPTAR